MNQKNKVELVRVTETRIFFIFSHTSTTFPSSTKQEMRELQRKLDHDIKLKEFFAIKGNLRVNADLEAREADRKQWQQELADKQLADLQNIMKQMQVRITV